MECRHCEDPAINVKGEATKLLPSRGANTNTKVQNCMPMLRAAIKEGYVKVVEAPLEYNADVNSTYEEDMTPLHLSALICNDEIVEMRLNKGATINAEATARETALDFAIKGNLTEVVELLLNRSVTYAHHSTWL